MNISKYAYKNLNKTQISTKVYKGIELIQNAPTAVLKIVEIETIEVSY